MSGATIAVPTLGGMADHPQAGKAAAELLEECWDGSLPIDPVRIAKALGVQVFNAPFKEEVSGALVKKEGKDPAIYLNRDDSKNRRRFTCAHELGHFIRRSDEPEQFEYVDYRDDQSATGTIEEERFANGFAASLLMPRVAVEALHEEGLPDYRMALRFGVSREAMKFRLDNLGLSG